MNLLQRYEEKLETHQENTDINLNGILVQMEVTNVCNHRCCFCPNKESGRQKKMIDVGFAKRVMAECAEFLGDDKRICFHMNGEPLLYKELPQLVRYSKELGYDYSFITTNGSVASEGLLTELFEAGLDSIKFSINAGTRETYKKIHGKDDFENALNALKFSHQYREAHNKNYKIFVSCVGVKDNCHELIAFRDLAEKYSDEVVFYYPCGYAGQNNDVAKRLRVDMSQLGIETFEVKHSSPCNVLWNSINITCEGYLALCCSEADNRLIVEDLNRMSVREAWLGDKMSRIRERHLAHDIVHMPCFSCISEKDHDEEMIDSDLFGLALEKKRERGRIKNVIESVDYNETLRFFEKRANNFQEEKPYVVTMYQDNHPEIAEDRNRRETEKLLPLLKINENSKILDIACGIGRWSDALKQNIKEYCGIDFSGELIKIARQRNKTLGDRCFLVGAATDTERLLLDSQKGKYDRILLVGILMYLNDADVKETLRQIERCCEDHAIICVREPIGMEDRLTLKNFYSEELKDKYNAIYRTRKEMDCFFEILLNKGFRVVKDGYLFEEDSLNNRKETIQYYYIFER